MLSIFSDSSNCKQVMIAKLSCLTLCMIRPLPKKVVAETME